MQLMETQRAEPSIQTEDTKEDVVVGPFSPLVFTPPPTVEEMFGFETNAAAGMIYLFFSSIFYITIEPFTGEEDDVIHIDESNVLENSLNLEKFACDSEFCGLKVLSSSSIRPCLISHLNNLKNNEEFYNNVSLIFNILEKPAAIISLSCFAGLGFE